MDNRRKVTLLSTCLILMQACFFLEPKKENFYTDALEESDVLRFPIIEPYDLLSTDPSTHWAPGKTMGQKFDINSTLDSINCQNGYISLWGVSSGINYGILDIDSSKKFINLNYSEFCEKAKTLGINNKLFHVQKVYLLWKRTHQLPWGSQILSREK